MRLAVMGREQRWSTGGTSRVLDKNSKYIYNVWFKTEERKKRKLFTDLRESRKRGKSQFPTNSPTLGVKN